jgi:hypothetical protein
LLFDLVHQYRPNGLDGVNYKKLPHLGLISQVSTCFGNFFKNLPFLGRGVTNWTDSRLNVVW